TGIGGPPEPTGADGAFVITSDPGQRMLVVLGGGGPIVTQQVDVASGATIDLGTITAKPHGGRGPAGGGSPGSGGGAPGGGGSGPGPGSNGSGGTPPPSPAR